MRLRLTYIALLASLWIAAPAEGQYGLGRGTHSRLRGQSGSALGHGDRLDNNLRAGSGGRNTGNVSEYYGRTIGQYGTARIGNAYVTGNVAGLGNFRDSIGYTAPNEFRGSLGSNDIYDFQRRSAGIAAYNRMPSSMTASPGRSYGTGASLLQRSGAGVSLGNIQGQNYGGYGGTAYPGARLDASALNYGTSFSSAQQTLAQGMDTQGNLIQVSTSPLKGLRYEQPYKAKDYQYKPPTPAPYSGITPPQATDDTGTGDTDAPAAPATLYNDLRQESTPMIPAIGQRLGERLRLTGLTMEREQTSPAEGQADRIQALNQSIFGYARDREKTETGQNPYLDMMRRIEKTEPDSQTTQPEQPVKKVTLEAILSKLDYEMPSVKSFIGKGDKPLDRALAQAEKAMSQQRYFDADQSYGTALYVEPGYPPAMVGQANARIGAGLYISAARGLRQLFDDHPEMISARYGPGLLPTKQRIAAIESQLLADLKENKPQPELAFILAYLGHQQQDTAQVHSALDRLEELADSDPLVPLLRRLWTEPADKPAGKPTG